MKKYFLFSLCAVVALSMFSQNSNEAKPKLSPLTKKFVHAILNVKEKGVAPDGFLYKYQINGTPFVSALIKVVEPVLAAKQLNNIDAKVATKAGNVWTVHLPFNKMREMTELSSVLYIQMDEPLSPALEKARQTTRTDSVHAGINLPMPYTGEGVIVGVIDFGFDYNHPTFYDTLHANFRVKRVWEVGSQGTPPAGFSYGYEITDTNLIKAQGTDNAKQTHGAAVAGMAAGSGYMSDTASLNKRFRGMAYESDMVFVGVRRDDISQQWLQGSFTDFLDGINYIFSYAASVGKPCVINISWGSQSGPHDGSTLFNEACANLTGAGKILVMSAGNEGEERIHLSKTFALNDTVVSTFLAFSKPDYKRTWIDVWGEPGQVFCGNVALYKNLIEGSSTNFICIDDNIHNRILINEDGTDTCFVQFISSTSEHNGKPRLTIDIYNKSSDSVGVSIKGGAGSTIHAWNEYYYYGYTKGFQSSFEDLGEAWAVKGNTATTVSDIGSGESVLLVGAYASKVNFSDINGNPWSYSGYVGEGKLVPFSSRGPLTNNTVKPDITAPGLTVATAVSSYDTAYTPTGSKSSSTVNSYFDSALNKTFYYGEFTGTSASAPAASGIVALLLQANPSLTPAQVKEIVTTTAIKDAHTGAISTGGNNNWGFGKINAYAALQKVLAEYPSSIRNQSGEKLDCILFPNPSNGTFSISYNNENDSSIRIEIFNAMGGLILAEQWHTTQGLNLKTIDLTQYSSGAYLVKVSSENGFATLRANLF